MLVHCFFGSLTGLARCPRNRDGMGGFPAAAAGGCAHSVEQGGYPRDGPPSAPRYPPVITPFSFGFGRASRGPAAQAPAKATVLVLDTLQPLVAALQAGLGEITAPEAERLAHQVARCGSAPVFRGDPAAARQIDRSLRGAGLTTSLNELAG